jgi:DNA polymerase-3 subunit alpha
VIFHVYLCTKNEGKKFRLDKEFWVKHDVELISNLKVKFGDENIKNNIKLSILF